MKAKLMISVLLSFLVLPMVLAYPGNWWGKAYIAGEQVPNGVTINAYINDILVATTKIGSLGSGYYELFIEGTAGDIIIFKIGSIDAEQTAVFSDGAHPQLDLTLAGPACGEGICNGNESCSTCALDCGACASSGGGGGSSGGGGGGGGGGGSSCTPNYVCRAISQCLPDGKQKQVCTDTVCNRGSYQQTVACTYVLPLTTQTSGDEGYKEEAGEGETGSEPVAPSTPEETIPENRWGFDTITGAVIGVPGIGDIGVLYLIFFILVMVLAGIYVYVKTRRKDKPTSY